MIGNVLLGLALAAVLAGPASAADVNWPYYGGDQGGKRYSAASQINPENVGRLTIAWRYSTGDVASKGAAIKRSSFEDTPILDDGRLYVCSAFDEVSALDPGTGRPIWRYDPKLATNVIYPNQYVCRGVAFWRDKNAASNGACATRIYLNTADRRLIAVDAATGRPCVGFGHGGIVAMMPDKPLRRRGEMQTTSAPVVADDLVIVGSSIDDNQSVNEQPGIVHAFDARTGAPRWSFDPLSGSPGLRAGAANAWAPMSVDEAGGLLYLPTSSPSPDFWGGDRKGTDRFADSVVALHLGDGKVAWSFQITHHDVWDYDVPAQPTLGLVTYQGKAIPAVLQPTKQGLLFTLDRTTGKPLIPVVERPVPQGPAPGEELSPTQPFPVAPTPLTPSVITPADAFGLTFWDRAKCREAISSTRHNGLYTPPSLQGTIVYPFSAGGTNWGGLAFDETNDIVYVNTSNAMQVITLIPRKDFPEARRIHPKTEISPNRGAPFAVERAPLLSPFGMPCNPPPWGQLHAIDMHSGRQLWAVPLGTTEDIAPLSEYWLGTTGTPNMGGPIVTAGGIVFIGAAMDNYLRAFDAKTGKELWRGRLPAGGQATPMTYVWKGRQFVVIAAGGHGKLDTTRGDQILAFALPK